DGQRHRAGVQTEVAAHDTAMLQKLRQDVLRHIDGDGEADALGRLDDGGIDSDGAAAAIHERAPAVGGIERRVRVNHSVDEVPGDGAECSAQGADDAGGYRGFEAERATDSNDELADA